MPMPGAIPSFQPTPDMLWLSRLGKSSWVWYQGLAGSGPVVRALGAMGCCRTADSKKNFCAGPGLVAGIGACTTRKPILPSFEAYAGAMLARLAAREKYGAVAGTLRSGVVFGAVWRKLSPAPRTTFV